MPVVYVDKKDLAAVLQKHFKNRQDSLIAATNEVTMRGVADAVATTNTENLVDLGTYKRGFRVVMASGPARGAQLRNDTPYAAVIEYGRRPNRPGPPLAPIRAWVERKLGLTGAEADRAAYLIRWAIHHRGTRPRWVMKRTYERMKLWFKAEAERRLKLGI